MRQGQSRELEVAWKSSGAVCGVMQVGCKLWGGLHSKGFILWGGPHAVGWDGSAGALLHWGGSAGAAIRRVWIGDGKATGVPLQAAARAARNRGHCQGGLWGQHFAGLQQCSGHPVLCSALGCNSVESPGFISLLHPSVWD